MKKFIRKLLPEGTIAIMRRSFYLCEDIIIERVIVNNEIKTMIIACIEPNHLTRIEDIMEKWLESGSINEDDPGTNVNTIIFLAEFAPALSHYFSLFYPTGYEEAIFPPVSVKIINGEGQITYPTHCTSCPEVIEYLLDSPDTIDDYNNINFTEEMEKIEVPLSFFNKINSLIRNPLIRILVHDSKLIIFYPFPMSDCVLDLCEPHLNKMYCEELGLDYEND